MTIEGDDVVSGEKRDDMNFHEQFVGESFGRINKAEADLTPSR